MKWFLSLLNGKTDRVGIQLLRYTFVGGFAFLVDFSALFILAEYAQIHYLVSAAMAFGLALATNYTISILWVFNKRSVRNRGLELAIFAALGVIGLGLNTAVMYVGTEWMGLYFMYSKVAATGLTFAWNFVSKKEILFSRPAHEQDFIHGFGSATLDLEV